MRVIVADDASLVRQGIARLLEDAGFEVVAQLPDAVGLASSVEALRPDVVVVDIRMPPTHTTEGLEAALDIKARHPTVGVLVLSQHVESRYAMKLLGDGEPGVGYLLKERVSDLDEQVRALQDVARGGSALDPKVVERLLARTSRLHTSALDTLTDRELEVLREVATGRSNAATAKALFMSERAVEKHVGSVFQKLGLVNESEVNRRVMAVLAFLEATGGPSTP